ncbi:MAG: HNH endonuclease [Proteobacteria bacterium]|nr:HNH endonuclease [Pseudomonadota bacterium]
MLLAIISLIENRKIVSNKIDYSPHLLELFKRFFDIVRAEQDALNPLLPFFYLRGDGFFHHRPFNGEDQSYMALSDPSSIKKFTGIVEYAYLDEELWAYLQDQTALNTLRDTLIQSYFPRYKSQIERIEREEKEISGYETILKGEPDRIKETKSIYRSTAFARTIREIYDYRCSACGLRLNLNGLVIIDAAHLIPFSESQDDDPRNGIALCKNHHWAMDKFLIVPGADNLWHVSPELDDRIEGCKEIINLNKRKILLPQDEKYYPKPESLTWRHERILR